MSYQLIARRSLKITLISISVVAGLMFILGSLAVAAFAATGDKAIATAEALEWDEQPTPESPTATYELIEMPALEPETLELLDLPLEPVAEPVAELVEVQPALDYDSMTYAQLKDEAKLQGLKFARLPKKAVLVEILKGSYSAEDDA